MRMNEAVKASSTPTAHHDCVFCASERAAGGSGLARPEQAGRTRAPGRALTGGLTHKVVGRNLPGRAQEDIA
jgi:hypothetical protein